MDLEGYNSLYDYSVRLSGCDMQIAHCKVVLRRKKIGYFRISVQGIVLSIFSLSVLEQVRWLEGIM